MSLTRTGRNNFLKRPPLFFLSVLALEASMAQGYKSDASHCANPDIAGEDVPTSIRNLVSDILKVRLLARMGMPFSSDTTHHGILQQRCNILPRFISRKFYHHWDVFDVY